MLQDLNTLISNVGFPIVISLCMFYQNSVLSQNYSDLTKNLEEKIEHNTRVLTELIKKLDA